MRLVLMLLLVSAVVFGEDEAKKTEEKKPKRVAPGDIEFGDPGVKIQDGSVARQEVVRFQKEWKAAKKDEFKRVELLKRLGKWDHAEVLKEAKKHIKHRSHLVAVEAVRVCVRQTSDVKKTGNVLLRHLGKEKRTSLRCALLVGLGYLKIDSKKAKSEAYKYFRKDTTETHKAATRYLGYIKEKEAFRMIAERLDEPRSKAPNDPNNPPASWWRERWHEWEKNVKWTRWAMSQLVEGETFESTIEAKKWAEAEGKKHGIDW